VEENPEGCTMERGRRYLKIGNELFMYEKYTTTPPYQFTGCTRGALKTQSYEFEKGFKFGLLDVDSWPIFVRFDQYTSIQDEESQRLAGIIEDAGFQFIYFDGAEDVNLPYWHTASKALLSVYNALKTPPLLSEGAIKPHFGWHILSRGNAFDTFDPDEIRLSTNKFPAWEAEYLSQDFTGINFGWVDYRAPRKGYIGFQPDMYEYVCSRAAAWDCPISLVANLRDIKTHPRTRDNFDVIRRWEDIRINNKLTQQQKDELKNLKQEHFILINEKGGYDLIPYQQITGIPDTTIRAFVYERNGKSGVVWC
jgi:hypothetical protein